MLSKDHFYFGMMKKYMIAFKHIMSDIHVLRTDSNDITIKDIIVPVTYANKSKLFRYLERDYNNVGENVRTVLPIISYNFSSMTFDPTRKKSNLNQFKYETVNGIETFQYAGNPYNFNVDMSIWAMYVKDIIQIIEQVAAFFKPDFTLSVNEIPELGITKNIPIILNSIDFGFENEFVEEDRVLKCDLNFTLKGYVYPPISNESIIEHIKLGFGTKDPNQLQEEIDLDWNDITETIDKTIIKV